MKPRSNYMPMDQMDVVIEHLPELHMRKWKEKDVAMNFKIARWCALRLIESTRLKVEDFDFTMKEVYLGKTKTRREDYAAIPDIFMPELALYLQEKGGGLLLDPIPKRDTVEKWIQKLGVICDVSAWTTPQSVTGEKTKMHIFRKSIGKDMVYGAFDGKKAPLNTVMKHLRHNSLDVTSRYLKVDIEEAKDYWASTVQGDL